MLKIKRVDNVYDPSFREMIFEYWQELMPKAAVLKSEEEREIYYKNDFASGDVYGAWFDDKLIGYLHLQVKNKVGVVEGIYITPNMRRHHLGTQVMSWAFEQFERDGIEQIDLYVRRDNPKAKAFYEALGFGVAGYRMRMYRKDGEVQAGILSSD